ncbi:MAG: PTS sugar transporter subunit IIA [Rectinema sp.]|nr:PTS sugar transporter subunit IIA [Rectinema sp.]
MSLTSPKDSSSVSVFNYTSVRYIADAPSVQSALEKLIATILFPPGMDRDALLDALLAREELMTTAIGNGIAIPHVRKFGSEALTEDIIAIAYLLKPIDWRAPDGKPVHTLFFVLARDEAHHLQIIADIGRLVSDESFVEFLKTMPDRKVLLEHVSSMGL